MACMRKDSHTMVENVRWFGTATRGDGSMAVIDSVSAFCPSNSIRDTSLTHWSFLSQFHVSSQTHIESILSSCITIVDVHLENCAFWERIRGLHSRQTWWITSSSLSPFRVCIRIPKGKPIGIFSVEGVINLERGARNPPGWICITFQLWKSWSSGTLTPPTFKLLRHEHMQI